MKPTKDSPNPPSINLYLLSLPKDLQNHLFDRDFVIAIMSGYLNDRQALAFPKGGNDGSSLL